MMSKMATLPKTSRTQVDRLLDPKIDITLGSLQRAAAGLTARVQAPHAAHDASGFADPTGAATPSRK